MKVIYRIYQKIYKIGILGIEEDLERIELYDLHPTVRNLIS